ncbi:MAG: nitrogen fixation protein NifB [Rhodospirillaceae bacterium]|nr:MAG: nitrogen fixation protein NifB [Rhodospirillaceae bacterium]
MNQQVIPFQARSGKAGKAGKGCSGCGPSEDPPPSDMPRAVWDKIQDHPCYSEEAHHYFARIHVAVAPACNIQCNYCNRKYDCANESRPGVVSERLTPEEALHKVIAVANAVPQLSVVGIAGPGDGLYDFRRIFATFRLIAQALPDLKLCLSTNGLTVSDHIDDILDLNIDHVTITINALDAEIAERLYAWVFFCTRRWTGREAARILLDRQMEGLERLTEAGVLVKVNSVLVPSINDRHLPEVNAAVKRRGAFLHNVMPLISNPAHGTRFGLTGQRGPTPMELKAVQDTLAGGARLMRHCRQCRADAVGLLGEDRGQEFTREHLPSAADALPPDPVARAAYRVLVEEERQIRRKASAGADQACHSLTAATPLLVAVCTKGGGRINQHFGHAREFQVFEADGQGVRFIGHRRADHYCQGGWGKDENLDPIITALAGIAVVLAAKVGEGPRAALARAGIRVLETHALEYIEPSVAAVFAAERNTFRVSA